MINTADVVRELRKVADVLEKTHAHFNFKDEMNAALHMSDTVRPTPLASAVHSAWHDLMGLIDFLENE